MFVNFILTFLAIRILEYSYIFSELKVNFGTK